MNQQERDLFIVGAMIVFSFLMGWYARGQSE